MTKKTWRCAECTTINICYLFCCKQCGFSRDESNSLEERSLRNGHRITSSQSAGSSSFRQALHGPLKNSAHGERELRKVVKTAKEKSGRAGNRGRGNNKVGAAIAIASNAAAVAEARANLKHFYFSENTIAAYESEVRLYEQVMIAAQDVPFPLSSDSIEKFASVLREAGYRGGVCYMTAIATQNKLLGYDMSPQEQFSMKMARIALKRDLGEEHSVDPIRLDQLKKLSGMGLSNYQLLVCRLSVVGIFFCLRPSEICGLGKVCICKGECVCDPHVILNDKCKTVTLRLHGDKTHQTGEILTLRLGCTCGGKQRHDLVPTCPYHVVRKIVDDSKHPVQFLSQGVKTKKLGYQSFLTCLKDMMGKLGRVVLDNGMSIYGGQSLRRAGAMYLAAANWTQERIRLWGRWAVGSRVVERYIRNAALMNHCPGEAMASVIGSFNDLAMSRTRKTPHGIAQNFSPLIFLFSLI